jgi:hypothetical protein
MKAFFAASEEPWQVTVLDRQDPTHAGRGRSVLVFAVDF